MSNLWQKCLDYLKNDIGIEETEYAIWLLPLHADISDSEIKLYSPNRFTLKQVTDKYLPQIIDFCRKNKNDLQFNVRLMLGDIPKKEPVREVVSNTASNDADELEKKLKTSTNLGDQNQKNNSKNGLVNYYSFDNFVKGTTNQLAWYAASNVAANLGKPEANPLFLYGSTGLGKTHLMHAIGNKALEKDPNIKVLYIRAESYMQSMVKAYHSNSLNNFKNIHRSLDLFLIDDIHFLSGKSGTQDEFFHNFNTLIENNKQIVICSDRSHHEITNIDKHLTSRFAGGQSYNIDPPDIETRTAILLKKAQESNFELSHEIALYIAQRIQTNVRELNGALNNIVAYYNLHAGKYENGITLDGVKIAIKDQLAQHSKIVSIDNIKKVVCSHFNIKLRDLEGSSRKKNFVVPRHFAISLCRDLTNKTYKEIGDSFGRDHASVINSCNRASEMCAESEESKQLYDELSRTISY